jgi:hypothetical protein
MNYLIQPLLDWQLPRRSRCPIALDHRGDSGIQWYRNVNNDSPGPPLAPEQPRLTPINEMIEFSRFGVACLLQMVR